jgi:C-terminal processing protease CtpA/Prc
MNRLHTLLAATITGGVVLVGQMANAQLVPDVVGQAGQAVQGAAGQVQGAAGQAQGQVRREAKQAQRETRQQGREAARDTRDAARNAGKDARDAARETGKDVRDTSKRARNAAKDTADDAKDTAKRARDTAKDTAKDTADDARDTAKNARDDAKDTAKSARNTAKDVAKDAKAANSKQSRKFDAKTIKADDLGLSLKASDDRGLTVSNISRNGLMADVGFQRNDRIVAVNDQRITRQGDFINYLFANNLRGRVPVTVMRGGTEEIVYVQPATIIRQYETVVVNDRDPIRDFGLVLDNDSDRLLVDRVIADSSADRAGIRPDDEILAVNDRDMRSADDLARMIEKHEDDSLDIEVRRARTAKVISVERVEFLR